MKALDRLLFSSRCLLCANTVEHTRDICEDCEKNICRVDAPTCNKCAESIYRCRCQKYRRTAYDSTAAVFYYRKSIKDGIHTLKFRRITSGAEFFGREMYELYKTCYADKNIDLIIPVPLYKTKLKERGFNQSLLIAKPISKLSGIPISKSLCKIKDTEIQHFLNREEREKNLRGAFRADETVKGKKILLIDDVITTGSTFNECAKELKRAGAEKVYALAACVSSE